MNSSCEPILLSLDCNTVQPGRSRTVSGAWHVAGITLLWMIGLNIGWDCFIHNGLWGHITNRNFHLFHRQLPVVRAVQGDCESVYGLPYYNRPTPWLEDYFAKRNGISKACKSQCFRIHQSYFIKLLCKIMLWIDFTNQSIMILLRNLLSQHVCHCLKVIYPSVCLAGPVYIQTEPRLGNRNTDQGGLVQVREVHTDRRTCMPKVGMANIKIGHRSHFEFTNNTPYTYI